MNDQDPQDTMNMQGMHWIDVVLTCIAVACATFIFTVLYTSY